MEDQGSQRKRRLMMNSQSLNLLVQIQVKLLKDSVNLQLIQIKLNKLPELVLLEQVV